jgi:hypothetical protein
MAEIHGETPGAAVAYNVRRIRVLREMRQRTLAEQMRRLGHRWNDTIVSRVETGERDVTVDELVGLGTALGIHPPGLLAPHTPLVSLGEVSERSTTGRALAVDERSVDAQTFSQWIEGGAFFLLAINGGLLVLHDDTELRAILEALEGDD